MNTPIAVVALSLLAGSTGLAQDKRYACSLLTVAEVGAFAGATVGAPMPHDEVLSDGPFKGETLQRCNWPLGEGGRAGNVYINVTATGATNKGQAGALLNDMAAQLKAQKWSVESTTVGGATCVVATSPAAQKSAAASCVTEARGKALVVASVGTGAAPSAASMKALLDKAASRLP